MDRLLDPSAEACIDYAFLTELSFCFGEKKGALTPPLIFGVFYTAPLPWLVEDTYPLFMFPPLFPAIYCMRFAEAGLALKLPVRGAFPSNCYF